MLCIRVYTLIQFNVCMQNASLCDNKTNKHATPWTVLVCCLPGYSQDPVPSEPSSNQTQQALQLGCNSANDTPTTVFSRVQCVFQHIEM